MNGSAGNGDPSELSSFNPDNAKYDSILGRVLCKMILAKYLPYDPHDYQLDGICSALDGFDLFATTPTGSGKMGYFIMFMLVIREIAANQALALGQEKIPKDPAMIVVCPTKALEDDMVWINSHRTVKIWLNSAVG
jgi:ATP-dependent helicase YprA (DUF1998 family)